MKTSHKITLEIPDELFDEISTYTKKARISDERAAVVNLIRYALTLPPYFKAYDWDKAEKEADSEIKAGRTKSFSTVDELLADLKS